MRRKITAVMAFILLCGIASAEAWTTLNNSSQSMETSGNLTSNWKTNAVAFKQIDNSKIQQPSVIIGDTLDYYSGTEWKSYGSALSPILNANAYASVTVNVDAAKGGEKIVVQLVPNNENAGPQVKIGLSKTAYTLNKGANSIIIPLQDFRDNVATQEIKNIAIHYGATYWSHRLNSDNEADITINNVQFNPKNP
jgi:hypothetical protein